MSKRLHQIGLAGPAIIMAACSAAQAAETAGPVLVEFFVSQSCSASAKAADAIAGIAARDDVVALGWHVDYWNALQTENGLWADPYSKAAFTLRQKVYNKNIRKRSSVYTPQIIIGGAREAVGAQPGVISMMIDQTRLDDAPVLIASARTDNGQIEFSLPKHANGDAFLVTFQPTAHTEISKGENMGLSYDAVNVVTAVSSLGATSGAAERITVSAPQEGYGCALVVQEPGQGRIVGAAYCAE